MANLAGKTYEVHVDSGDGHWTVVDIHQTRSASLEQAEQLVESGNYAGVRVLSDSDRVGTETIFENINEHFDDRPITIVPIDHAPICHKLEDYYGLESRRTIGQLMRNYLEAQGCTALELLYDASKLKILERNDSFYPQAMQQIAGVQARITNSKPSQRADVLYKAAGEIQKNAVALVGDDTGYKVLKEKGIDALIRFRKTAQSTEEKHFLIRHAFARVLNDGGGWDAKIELMVKFGDGNPSRDAIEYLDEVLAEILDGTPAIRELLAGQPDAATANRVLIMLCEGRAKAPANPLSCIEAFNALMGQQDLVQTRKILLEHVKTYVSGTKPLTREGGDVERKAFSLLVRDLSDVAGIMGGPGMCEAVVQRGRLALSGGGDDLAFPDALVRVVNLLPHRASRIGFMVELSLSGVSKEQKGLVLSMLGKTVEQLTSLASLVPKGSTRQQMVGAIEGLKKRLTSDDIPAEWRDSLTRTFDELMSKPESTQNEPHTYNSNLDEELRQIMAEVPEKKEVSKGEILFEEGDSGEEAYLILEGEVEIFQRIGEKERVIATLGRGEIIGEMSLIDSQPRMASARVLDNSKVTIITQKNLTTRLKVLGENDKVLRRLLDVLVNRLRGDAHGSI